MRRLDYFWRLFGTGLSFMLFGIGGIVLSITAFPLMNLLIADRGRRAEYAQRLVHSTFRIYVWFMRRFGVIDLTLAGQTHLACDTGTLIAANHPSLLDVVVLMSLMERAQCIVKPAIWRNPFMRGVVRATGYIRSDDDPERLLQACDAALRAGNNLIIFPEGSRTVPGTPLRLQRGVANIALRAGAPIRPVTIECVPATLMKGQKWYEIPPTRAHFTLRVQERIETDEYVCNFCSTSVSARRLTEHLGERLRNGTA